MITHVRVIGKVPKASHPTASPRRKSSRWCSRIGNLSMTRNDSRRVVPASSGSSCSEVCWGSIAEKTSFSTCSRSAGDFSSKETYRWREHAAHIFTVRDFGRCHFGPEARFLCEAGRVPSCFCSVSKHGFLVFRANVGSKNYRNSVRVFPGTYLADRFEPDCV